MFQKSENAGFCIVRSPSHEFIIIVFYDAGVGLVAVLTKLEVGHLKNGVDTNM